MAFNWKPFAIGAAAVGLIYLLWPKKAVASSATKPSSKQGYNLSSVVGLQKALLTLGYSVGASGADGKFGSGTESAVKAFQKSLGLSQSGVFDGDTCSAMVAALGSKGYSAKCGETLRKTGTVPSGGGGSVTIPTSGGGADISGAGRPTETSENDDGFYTASPEEGGGATSGTASGGAWSPMGGETGGTASGGAWSPSGTTEGTES